MKILQSFLTRALIAIVAGLLVIGFRGESLTYILSTILIIGAINQFINLGIACKDGKVGWGWWLMPAIILGTSIFILAKRINPVTTELQIIGWGLLIYGAMECAIAIKVRQVERQRAAIERADRQEIEERARQQAYQRIKAAEEGAALKKKAEEEATSEEPTPQYIYTE